MIRTDFIASMQLNEHVYKTPSYTKFFEPAYNLARATLTPSETDERWTPKFDTYQGVNGWIVLMLKHEDLEDIANVKKLCLFQMNESCTSYDYVSTTLEHIISDHMFTHYGGRCDVEQVGPLVHVTIHTQSVDFMYDIGNQRWVLLQYTFNTTNNMCTYNNIPLYDARIVGNVVFTTRLTLGRST